MNVNLKGVTAIYVLKHKTFAPLLCDTQLFMHPWQTESNLVESQTEGRVSADYYTITHF